MLGWFVVWGPIWFVLIVMGILLCFRCWPIGVGLLLIGLFLLCGGSYDTRSVTHALIDKPLDYLPDHRGFLGTIWPSVIGLGFLVSLVTFNLAKAYTARGILDAIWAVGKVSLLISIPLVVLLILCWVMVTYFP